MTGNYSKSWRDSSKTVARSACQCLDNRYLLREKHRQAIERFTRRNIAENKKPKANNNIHPWIYNQDIGSFLYMKKANIKLRLAAMQEAGYMNSNRNQWTYQVHSQQFNDE
ncbi:hypothetical protein RF11_14378 [Thelohanellus kitauei]|uniref:Uncharacterized protein n=1 Tax=Thelohanellus kitauei TaxID=669202 RepID=A0A0C2NDU9_THEKT|nr:hypothetical protein RF11_14378 [Thelohanellus kitauei]